MKWRKRSNSDGLKASSIEAGTVSYAGMAYIMVGATGYTGKPLPASAFILWAEQRL
ncbi:hypothetical protein KCP73_05465 [Salmonella enterica subsp. enterica]|nr:hypothetical protein KCP73_05465 [Salmonella enterica subsp. enterica]